MMFYALERGNGTGHISAHILPSVCPLDRYSNVVDFNILVLMPPLLIGLHSLYCASVEINKDASETILREKVGKIRRPERCGFLSAYS